ncbi:MAG TPA: entericidin EcnA/B family protein [Alphaproteobacteria bacterium]|nr:entericidin EcnA/B family protein [Alphaproteobacteria bacterium]
MKKIILFAILLMAAASVSSCNTVSGMGRDIESLGRGMQKSSN